MPERTSIGRRSTESGGRKVRPPHPLHSPSRRIQPQSRRSTKKHSRPIKILKRCSSEPVLWSSSCCSWVGGPGGGGDNEVDDQQKILWCQSESGLLPRPHTFTDVLASPNSLRPSSSQNFEGFKKDMKVAVNVTVEGSPGPVRTTVKLGFSVEDTIKLVVDRYCEEGRSPKLDKDGCSSYELHDSYFSLMSLDKSESIGAIGSRSFYLRTNSSNRSRNGVASPSIFDSGNTLAPTQTPASLLPSFLANGLSKIMRRSHRLWKVLVCWK